MSTTSSEPSADMVLQALRAVEDPDLRKDIVSLGFINNLQIEGGEVAFDLELTTPACPMKEKLKTEAEQAVKGVAGVSTVKINMTARVRTSPVKQAAADGLKDIKNTVAVASGKGGVGKSTVTVNLALSLAAEGARVGLLDADVYGPSVPRMLGEHGMPDTGGEKLKPVRAHGVKFISMGLLIDQATPVIWRGPMATKLIQQFLSQVEWGELDYLLIDLPPGTGDVQLTLAQSASLTGAVVVTTPQEVAVEVTLRGLRMFEQVRVPILGVVENMSCFVCPHCGGRSEVFKSGGGERAAKELGFRFLGGVPLDPSLAAAGDSGLPLVVSAEGKNSPAAAAFNHIAKELAAQVSIVNELSAEVRCEPAQVTGDEDAVIVEWAHGKKSRLPFRELRCACPCAECVDEWTGEKRLDDSTVPPDIKPVEINPVGRYAVRITWSDGHSSGIYSFNTLHRLSEEQEK